MRPTILFFLSVAMAFCGLFGAMADDLSSQSATLVRAINLNGPAFELDGITWSSGENDRVLTNGSRLDNQSVTLRPATTPEYAHMIRTSFWSQELDIEIQELPTDSYQVFLYLWEDNHSERFSISLNGRSVVREFESGSEGSWKRLGPWRTQVRDGTLRIATRGGAANLSGIEIWRNDGVVPTLPPVPWEKYPTTEQLAFFENRIRPLLIEHCYDCHSANAAEPGGGLLLDSRPGIMVGGVTEPPIIPGDPDNSLLMKAVRHLLPNLKMPPDGQLSQDEISDLEAWIRMRAPDPRVENTPRTLREKFELNWEQARNFWSLQPIRDVPPPEVKNSFWPLHDLDRFTIAKMEERDLQPSEEADRRTWLRRATYDLTGLPPTPEEIESFVSDTTSAAYEKVIDRLLESPRYGERWGRYWLDVVRYSDTAGDNSDFPVPQVHLYRDWVIDAFNRDVPYDDFVREQLAGDLLDSDSPEQRRSRWIATGYLANARRFGSRVDDYPQHLTIEDTLDNLGKAFLGTTLTCARCHHHKFDPILTDDYYGLYGIFQSTKYPWPGIELDQRQRDFVPIASAELVEQVEKSRRGKQKELDDRVKQLAAERDKASGPDREELEKQRKAAEDEARAFAAEPMPYETIYAVRDDSDIGDAAIQIKGDPNKLGPVVPRRFLKVLGGHTLDPSDSTSGRLQLAEWIVSPDNPLTARVAVNRIWLYHFGQPLVPTPNDFGRQGKPPTHPELLDWLAKRFIESGWSIKAMHRLIMSSRTYRLSSLRGDEAVSIDPMNIYLSSYPRHRLDAESIRDTLLVLGDNLDLTPPGPHPFPHPKDWRFTQHNPFKAVYATNRRSVYLMTQRIQRHPFLGIFDGPDPAASTPQRLTSTTPLQALFLLNDPFVHDQASRFVDRIMREGANDIDRIEQAWLYLLSRPPDSQELEASLAYLDSARKLCLASNSDSSVDREAWNSWVRAMFRLNEFIYVE